MIERSLLILREAIRAIHIIRVVLILFILTPSKVACLIHVIDLVLLLDIVQI